MPKDGDLLNAAIVGNLEAMRKAVDGGANVNYVSDFGYSVLYCAIRGGTAQGGGDRGDIVEFLIEKGCDIDKIDKMIQAPPINFAAGQDKKAIVKALAPKMHYINHGNSRGENALHMTQSSEVSTALIENGANVNAVSKLGQTPLHVNVSQDLLDLKGVQALIDAGCLLNVLDNNGKTPLDIAANSYENNMKDNIAHTMDLLELLIKNGATFSASDDITTDSLDMDADLGLRQFIEERGPILRKEYLEKPRKEFTQELDELFNEPHLTRGALFDLYYEGRGQPKIHARDLQEITAVIAEASKEDRANGTLAKKLQELDSPYTRYYRDSYDPAELTSAAAQEELKEVTYSPITEDRKEMDAKGKIDIDADVERNIQEGEIEIAAGRIETLGGSVALAVRHTLDQRGDLSYLRKIYEEGRVDPRTNLDTEDQEVIQAINKQLPPLAAPAPSLTTDPTEMAAAGAASPPSPSPLLPPELAAMAREVAAPAREAIAGAAAAAAAPAPASPDAGHSPSRSARGGLGGAGYRG